MKKSIKILSVLMMSIMMIMTVTPVFASNQITPIPPTNTQGILDIAGKILGFLRWIALIGGTILIAILGIKYMMGSLEEKAQYQKSFVPLVVGVIVVMGAVTIANLIVNTFTTTT